jgi:hypothetical protein
MRTLRPQPPQKPHVKPEWRKALQLLARNLRRAMEDVLRLGHGFSRETLAKLMFAGLAKLVTETLRIESGRRLKRANSHPCRGPASLAYGTK